MEREIIARTIDVLNNGRCDGMEISEIHNEIFNTDYFIIGTYQAAKWLEGCEDGVFGAIGIVQKYEKDTFGKVYTDFSDPELVVNMYVYIKGQELLDSCGVIGENWETTLNDQLREELIKELEEAINKLNEP